MIFPSRFAARSQGPRLSSRVSAARALATSTATSARSRCSACGSTWWRGAPPLSAHTANTAAARIRARHICRACRPSVDLGQLRKLERCSPTRAPSRYCATLAEREGAGGREGGRERERGRGRGRGIRLLPPESLPAIRGPVACVAMRPRESASARNAQESDAGQASEGSSLLPRAGRRRGRTYMPRPPTPAAPLLCAYSRPPQASRPPRTGTRSSHRDTAPPLPQGTHHRTF